MQLNFGIHFSFKKAQRSKFDIFLHFLDISSVSSQVQIINPPLPIS